MRIIANNEQFIPYCVIHIGGVSANGNQPSASMESITQKIENLIYVQKHDEEEITFAQHLAQTLIDSVNV